MRKDHRPYWLYKLSAWINRFYVTHYIAPQCTRFGKNCEIIAPHRLEIFGDNISIGDHAHIQTAKGSISRLCTWKNNSGADGHITIGNHVLISPAMHMVSASAIEIGDNVMFAGNVYISDADWHGIYDRIASPGTTAPIIIRDNAWIGEGSKILKGVSIGKNAIIGAGSIVTKSIPDNVIAAGNPARVIKKLDNRDKIKTRAALFADENSYQRDMRYLYKLKHKENSTISWIKSKIFPGLND